MDQPIAIGVMGAIKIKDGLFIGDEFSAQVHSLIIVGLRICYSQ
jgi:hypothetical protein